jgi:glutaredoxin-like protein DUF836
VTLYSRPECHLCDEVRERLERMRATGSAFEIEEIDIDGDDALFTAYLERIPVVAIAGEVVSELFLDETALRARLDTVGA